MHLRVHPWFGAERVVGWLAAPARATAWVTDPDRALDLP
jgi:hypothetical protein